jgi:methyl-accepting chemotaxis protein
MAKPREMPADVERTRSVVVDPSMQWTAALSVGSVIASGLVLLAMSRFMSSTTDGGDMSSQDSAVLAVIWNAVLIGFVMAVVTTFILVFTRRVAGAARVLERAVDGMCDDDLDRSTTLRRKDPLQTLAAGVGRLAGRLRDQRDRLRVVLERIDRDLASDDLEAARRTLQSFRVECRLVDDGAVTPPVNEEHASAMR